MNLVVKRFDELTLRELYEILAVRARVFVVEQNCVYQDLDGVDQRACHVFYRSDEGIQAYLRVFPGEKNPREAHIGRVLTVKRGAGLGKRIVREGVRVALNELKAERIVLDAQTYVRKLYEDAGFRQISDEFTEDGIPHITMEYQKDAAGT